MKEKISLDDAIKQVIMMLSNIQIPVGLTRQIGMPICNATDALREILIALDGAKKEEGGDEDVPV